MLKSIRNGVKEGNNNYVSNLTNDTSLKEMNTFCKYELEKERT